MILCSLPQAYMGWDTDNIHQLSIETEMILRGSSSCAGGSTAANVLA